MGATEGALSVGSATGAGISGEIVAVTGKGEVEYAYSW